MTKTEFLSASLPYGVKVTFEADEYNHSLVGVECNYVTLISPFNDYGRAEIQKTIPIVRPLSDLTKPIVQADYNGGKSFVPIVELAKIAFQKLKWDIGFEDGRCCLLYSGGARAYEFTFSMETLSFYCFRYRTHEACAVPYQSELFQLMYKFHFDLITEDCEKLYVSDEFNPYK